MASSWRRPPNTGPAPHYLSVIRVETSILPIRSPRGWKGKIDRSRERTVGGGFARPGSHFTVMLKMKKKKKKKKSPALVLLRTEEPDWLGNIPAGIGTGGPCMGFAKTRAGV